MVMVFPCDGLPFATDYRAVDGGIDMQFVRLLALDRNSLGDALHLLPLAAVAIAHRIFAVDGLDEIVDRVGLHISETPGVVIAVADDNGWSAGEGDAGEVLSINAKMTGVPDGR
jgi:hypothetical protein